MEPGLGQLDGPVKDMGAADPGHLGRQGAGRGGGNGVGHAEETHRRTGDVRIVRQVTGALG